MHQQSRPAMSDDRDRRFRHVVWLYRFTWNPLIVDSLLALLRFVLSMIASSHRWAVALIRPFPTVIPDF